MDRPDEIREEGSGQLEALADHAARTDRALEALRKRAAEIDAPILDEALERLTATLEELHVSAEELATQNEQLRELQRELEVERQRYAGLFRAAPEAYLVTDPHGIIREANDRASDMLGRTPDDLTGKPFASFVAEDEARTFRSWVNELRRGSVTVGRDVTLETDGGPRQVVATRVEPERDDRGDVVALRWQLHDMTDVREGEAALRSAYAEKTEALEQLRELDRWKNAFLAAAAHDLRSPLTSIAAYGEILSGDEPIAADDRRDIGRRIRANATHVLRLLSDLLDLDRLTRGEVHAERAPTRIDELVGSALERIDTAEHHVTVDVPAISATIDPGRVGQIVANLVRNAVVHTPPGTRIAIHVEPYESGIRLIVEDDGPGVPDEVADVLFAPFATHRSHPDGTLGTGIGLTLVALFAELHGGAAWTEPNDGAGARFVVELPGSTPVPSGLPDLVEPS